MFSPANHAAFTLDISTLEHDFKVLAFHGTEALSQCYCFELDLISEQPDIDLDSLLHQPACLTIGPDQVIHGLIAAASQDEGGQRLHRYQITLVPQLDYLRHCRDQRIFQHLSVPQIISRVLQAQGIPSDAFRFQLGSDYPERRYCTQYNESNLDFIQRLCAEEGIHYHFQHSPQGHELIFADDQTAFPQLDPVGFAQGTGMVADEPVIKRFRLRHQTRSSQISHRDYRFDKPKLQLHSDASHDSLPTLEAYNYPGSFSERPHGKRLAQRQLEAKRSDSKVASGTSDQPTLRSGHFLPLEDHPNTAWNDLWLITQITHQGKQPQVLEEFAAADTMAAALTPSPLAGWRRNERSTASPAGTTLDGSPGAGGPWAGWGEGERKPSGTDATFDQGYRNHFQATPWDYPWRPTNTYPKPRLYGTQSAIVTGPEGEEIHCDEHGRVKVQFHWDREGQGDDSTSCWLQVASGWAGNGYGAISIPRVGMEVLVSFLDGDPDHPLIIGSLYHGLHRPPYELPEHNTRSVFKSLSSPGGDGYNEVRIDDRAGAEQIYIHAQRDWDHRIGNDHRIDVAHQRHEKIGDDHYRETDGDTRQRLHGERRVEIDADDHLTVHGSQHSKADQAQLISAGNEIHYYAGQTLVIDAGMELTAKGGGSLLKLDPGGVSLKGPGVRINSGGSAGKGSGVKVRPPGE